MNKIFVAVFFFVSVLMASPPAWMEEQIQEDLRPFSTQLDPLFLDQVFAFYGESHNLIRITVREGNLHFVDAAPPLRRSVEPWLVKVLRKMHAQSPLPDVDFLFFPDCTNPFSPPGATFPIFCENRAASAIGILCPNRWALLGDFPERAEALAGSALHPWETKHNTALFRGPCPASSPGWHESPGVTLVRLASLRPDLINAHFFWGIEESAQMDDPRVREVMVSDFIPLSDQVGFKYLLDLNVPPPYAAAALHSNSVLLRYENLDHHEWWHRALEPYVHYIPLERNLLDVVAQIKWAKEHDAECQAISTQARELALDLFSEERAQQYLRALLIAYARQQAL